MKVGIIGGSGVDDLLFTDGFEKKAVATDYGEISLKQGEVEGRAVLFLNRHGENYTPPSKINYRGNIEALKIEGVETILATAAVGSINPRMKPGDFVLLTDFIDFTQGRAQTFSDSSFIDMSRPYASSLVQKLAAEAAKLRIKTHPGATYVCTEGPRFETKAEIKMFAKLGADVVGMTNVPEVVLAAEARIPYAVVGVVTNFAAGVSPKKVSAEEVMVVMGERKQSLSNLVAQVIRSI